MAARSFTLMSVTTTPRIGRICVSPRVASWRRASRTGVRETLNCSASVRSSSLVPGANLPLMICSEMSEASLAAMVGMWVPGPGRGRVILRR